jgi:hypothetical protein
MRTLTHTTEPKDGRWSADAVGPRKGLSRRDVLAFIEAWERGPRARPLADYLGWGPMARSGAEGGLVRAPAA